jgi:hypothetical protein
MGSGNVNLGISNPGTGYLGGALTSSSNDFTYNVLNQIARNHIKLYPDNP